MEEPSFTLQGINIRPVALTEMTILVDLDVYNPNNFDLKLKSFDYRVYLKNEEIGSGRLEKELLVSSSSTTKIQAPVAARFKDLNAVLKLVWTEGNLPYKIEGSAEVKTFWGGRNLLFTKEGQIDLRK